MHVAFWGISLIGVATAVSCTKGGAEVPKALDESSASTASERPVESARSSQDQDALTVSGALLVEHQLDVAALRDGVVSKISADLDTPVRKGQVLATLDDRQIKADRDAAEARVEELESDLKNWDAEVRVLEADRQRAEKMWEAQLITKEQLDHIRYNLVADQYQAESAKHKLDNARATFQSLELEIEKTRICAPFDGVVARRYVREGQLVSNGDRMFWVTSVAPLLVRFTVPDRLAGSIKRGQEVRITSDATQGAARVAKITSVSPVIDPSSSTIEVVGTVSGPPGDLRSGMTVNITLRNGH
jgi:RND family efflux transporter MFP subunit